MKKLGSNQRPPRKGNSQRRNNANTSRNGQKQNKPNNNGRRYYKGEDVRDNKFIWGHQPGSSIKEKQYKIYRCVY